MTRQEIKKLDNEFSRLIRQRNVCENGGEVGGRCGGVLQCSHIIRRSVMRLRWEPRNALALCIKHHLWWWHKEPLEAVAWFRKKFGDHRYHWLLNESRQLGKTLTVEEVRGWWSAS